MTEVFMTGSEFENVREIHEFLAKELNLPSYYGKNLDALYDVLTELCEDTKIILDFSGVEDGRMLNYFRRMEKVLKDAAEADEYLKVEIKSRQGTV